MGLWRQAVSAGEPVGELRILRVRAASFDPRTGQFHATAAGASLRLEWLQDRERQTAVPKVA